jgi:hypothetical protein
MVELALRRSTSPRKRRDSERRVRRRAARRVLPWAELAAEDENLWELLEPYRRKHVVARAEVNRALVVVFALSLLVWLVLAFAAVEVLAAL